MLALSPERTPGPEIPPPENEARDEELPEGVIDKRKFFRGKIADNKLHGLDELFGYHPDSEEDEE